MKGYGDGIPALHIFQASSLRTHAKSVPTLWLTKNWQVSINGKWEYWGKDGKDNKNLCIWVMKLDVWLATHYKPNFSEAVGI